MLHPPKYMDINHNVKIMFGAVANCWMNLLTLCICRTRGQAVHPVLGCRVQIATVCSMPTITTARILRTWRNWWVIGVHYDIIVVRFQHVSWQLSVNCSIDRYVKYNMIGIICSGLLAMKELMSDLGALWEHRGKSPACIVNAFGRLCYW